MRRLGRQALAVMAWVFVGGVVLQVFFAGMGLFGVTSMEYHVGFGYLLPYVPMLMALLALVARPDRRTAALLLLLLLLGGFVQPMLPWLRQDLPLVAALHPPNALIVFWIGLVVARRTTRLVRSTSGGPQPIEGSTQAA